MTRVEVSGGLSSAPSTVATRGEMFPNTLTVRTSWILNCDYCHWQCELVWLGNVWWLLGLSFPACLARCFHWLATSKVSQWYLDFDGY